MDVMEMELDLGEKLESEEEGEGDGVSDVEKEDARLLCIYTLHIQVLQDLTSEPTRSTFQARAPSTFQTHCTDKG